MFCALLAALTAINRSDVPVLGAPGVDLAAPDRRPGASTPSAPCGPTPTAPPRTPASARPTFSAHARPATRRSTRAPTARSPPPRRRDSRELGALIGAGTLAGLRHDFHEQLRLGMEARRVAPDAGAAPDRGGRRADRAGQVRGRRPVDPAPPGHQAGPGLVLARLLPPRAERRPGGRRGGDAPGGVGGRRLAREPRLRPVAPGRPRAPARPRRRRRATPTWARCAPCASTRRRWSGSRAWMPCAAGCARRSRACGAPRRCSRSPPA